jgi:protein TonB
LAVRNRAARRAARRRAAAHTRKPLTPEQRARRRAVRPSPAARLAKAVGAVLGSAAAHAAIVLIGIAIAAFNVTGDGNDREQVSIEVREHEQPRPKQEPKPPPPEPEQVAAQPEPKAPAAPKKEEPEEQPEREPDAPPMRVVGLSLEATVEGGGGPAFAVGQTRMGQTAKRAVDPRRKVSEKAPIARSNQTPRTEKSSANRAASRIPTAKSKITLPKRKRPRRPPYPPELKAQGIEATIVVMVTLDETGKVTSVKIITPSAYPAFNEAARSAALGEQFEPALRDGVPIPYTLSYRYRFRIEEQ